MFQLIVYLHPISQSNNKSIIQNEMTLASYMIQCISQIQNVDEMIELDPTLKAKLFKENAEILQKLGYDMLSYDAFISGI